ncbi:MAG: hypothetical protein KGO50_10395 [Myxococcales bacterium]|nr:hypothetical protein [Myxococcales bacterium]
MLHRPALSLRNVLFSGLLAVSVPGCDGCQEQPDSGTSSSSVAEPVATTPLLARVPADVAGVLVLRDWDAVSSLYRSLRARLETLTALGVIETDLRNTAGIDLQHPETLTEIGVAYPGQAALVAPASGRSWILLALSDASRFEPHVTRVFTGQPFNLAGPVERLEDTSGVVLGFRSDETAPVQLQIAIGTSHAAFLTGESDLQKGLALLASPSTPGIAGSASFQAFFSSDAPDPLVFHGTGAGLRSVMNNIASGDLADLLSIEQLDALQTLSLSVNADADSIDGRVVVGVSERAAEQFAEMTSASTEPPDFGRLTLDSTYALARFTLKSDTALQFWLSELSEGRRDAVQAQIDAFSERIGMQLTSEILPALGTSGFLMATETRMLTLRRAVQSPLDEPGALFTGLGLVMGLRIHDRSRIDELVTRLVATSDGRATSFAENGNTVVQFNDEQTDVGTIVLTDDFFLLVPSRDREAFLAAMNDAEAGRTFDEPRARAMLSEPVANGLYIDLARVLSGPLGAFLTEGVNAQTRTTLASLRDLYVSIQTTPTGLDGDFSVRFAAADSAPESGSGATP